MGLRLARPDDIDPICVIEDICFPAHEAASRASLENRLRVFPNHFWVVEEGGMIVGFANGMITENDRIIDEMFKHVDLHDETAGWQCIFGLAVHPDHRKHGYAGLLLAHMIEQARLEGRKGLTLTCKDFLIAYYEKQGFYNAWLSPSHYAGETWYIMKVDL